ncbi:hypothetical protein [Streptomyces sp. P9-A2]|uniref:hypothetical protein n=1 Tax=Streptomyces sp. P9-A2 TaxID=3072284 RepID=UPI002FCACFBD
MRLYLAIPSVVVALLFAALGMAAITRGWVLPMNRRHVRHVRLYGWGQLVAAVGLCCQVVFGLVINGIGIRQWGTITGSVLMVTGLIVMVMGQLLGGKRQVSGMP